uniref:Uncharacterized protein n=2 Tax=Poecilia TaxID=8080 RepID=A0A3B3V9I9_9TELE
MAFAGKHELETHENHEEFSKETAMIYSNAEFDLQGTAKINDGKLSLQFPESFFTAEIVNDKLEMTCVTPGENGVTYKRVSRRI